MTSKYELLPFEDEKGNFYWRAKGLLIAFWPYDGDLYVVENQWGPFLSEYINMIEPDKSKRLPLKEFNEKYRYFLLSNSKGLENLAKDFHQGREYNDW